MAQGGGAGAGRRSLFGDAGVTRGLGMIGDSVSVGLSKITSRDGSKARLPPPPPPPPPPPRARHPPARALALALRLLAAAPSDEPLCRAFALALGRCPGPRRGSRGREVEGPGDWSRRARS